MVGKFSCSNYEQKRSYQDLVAASKNAHPPPAYTGLKYLKLNRNKYAQHNYLRFPMMGEVSLKMERY